MRVQLCSLPFSNIGKFLDFMLIATIIGNSNAVYVTCFFFIVHATSVDIGKVLFILFSKTSCFPFHKPSFSSKVEVSEQWVMFLFAAFLFIVSVFGRSHWPIAYQKPLFLLISTFYKLPVFCRLVWTASLKPIFSSSFLTFFIQLG